MKFSKKMVLLPYDRYLRLQNRQGKDDAVYSTTRRTAEITEEAMPEEGVLLMLPKRLQSKGHSLLYFIKHHTEIEWNECGQIILDGSTIPYSHISDLIKDALVTHKTFVPAGMDYFYRQLKHVPLTLIQNKQRRLLIHAPKLNHAWRPLPSSLTGRTPRRPPADQ